MRCSNNMNIKHKGSGGYFQWRKLLVYWVAYFGSCQDTSGSTLPSTTEYQSRHEGVTWALSDFWLNTFLVALGGTISSHLCKGTLLWSAPSGCCTQNACNGQGYFWFQFIRPMWPLKKATGIIVDVCFQKWPTLWTQTSQMGGKTTHKSTLHSHKYRSNDTLSRMLGMLREKNLSRCWQVYGEARPVDRKGVESFPWKPLGHCRSLPAWSTADWCQKAALFAISWLRLFSLPTHWPQFTPERSGNLRTQAVIPFLCLMHWLCFFITSVKTLVGFSSPTAPVRPTSISLSSSHCSQRHLITPFWSNSITNSPSQPKATEWSPQFFSGF